METNQCMENLHSSSSSENQNRTLKDDDVDIDEKIHEENPYGDFYMNDETLPDFEVKNLCKIIQENSLNEDDGFKKEYAVSFRNRIYIMIYDLLPKIRRLPLQNEN